MTKHMALLLASICAAASPSAMADEIKGMLELRMSEPTIYEAQSAKRIIDLEYCVANAISASAGIPRGAYHDGPDRLVIFGNRIAEYKVFLVVTLDQSAEGTSIGVRGRNENTLKGFQDVLERCI